MPERLIRINLGCGLVTIPGFDNIDNSPSVFLARHPWLKTLMYRVGMIRRQHFELEWPTDIIWRDARRHLPYVTGTVDRIYSSHFLEHVVYADALKILRECHRILRPGGLFRLIVPDLLYWTRKYVEETDALLASGDMRRDVHDEFMIKIAGGFLTRRRSAHFYMYDWPTMKMVCEEVGFTQVRHCGYQESADPDFARLDSRPKDSLHVEMTRSA